ncbi:hypothetical protein [Amycolatopsis japonica]
MIYIGPLRRPKRNCGALTALETATFTTGVAGVIVLEQLSGQLLLPAAVVVLLLALVRGVPLAYLRFPDGGATA